MMQRGLLAVQSFLDITHEVQNDTLTTRVKPKLSSIA